LRFGTGSGVGLRFCIGGREPIDELACGFRQALDTNEAPAVKMSLINSVKNIESACKLMEALAGDLQAGKRLAGSLLKDRQT